MMLLLLKYEEAIIKSAKDVPRAVTISHKYVTENMLII